MKINKIRLALLLALLFALLSACNRNSPVQVEKIVLGTETVAHASPVWIAERKGYFKEEGLDVEIQEFESGRTALRTMLNQDGISIVTAAQTPVVFNSFGRNDYAIVGNMVYSDKDLKILTRRNGTISAPSDLRGKTFGITAGSSGHFFLSLFLTYNGLKMTDVKTIDMEATRLPQALIDGRVDAIATWEPHIYRAKKALGDRTHLMPSGGIYREDYYFVARKDFIQQHPEALRRFLRAIEKGEEFIRKNKKEAMDIVGQRLKMDREILDATWDDFQFRLSLDQPLVVALEDEARWAIRNKLTGSTKVPNFLDYVYADALKAVKPGAVTIAGR
ncbi:MAG TPA: ABC transporter substrate-binding protein [Syntrophorhabdaceae bacterium]|nr:ABC transporter substrate-binding protein [Syntrophorhabdaceae bacterium]